MASKNTTLFPQHPNLHCAMASSKPVALISLFIFLACVAHQISSAGQYVPISYLQDPEIIDLAKFAVEEHVKKNHVPLTFSKILKGYVQVVNGLNYKLYLTATDGDSHGNYEAIVWTDVRKTSRRLVSFKNLLTN